MKKILLIIGVAVAIICILITQTTQAQSQNNTRIRLNAGIVTSKLAESKDFYFKVLNFGVSFENEFYLLMHTPNQSDQISFLLPNHPSQQALFKTKFAGKGMYITIEVENVEEEYNRIKTLGVPIAIELRTEPWGDKHFAIVDPNGIGIDIVTYEAPTK
jgi:catechol 2,3-dioxygenase-like lactoylglutathione lyase family enzyme